MHPPPNCTCSRPPAQCLFKVNGKMSNFLAHDGKGNRRTQNGNKESYLFQHFSYTTDIDLP